jgi:hypothetical protein
VRGCRAVDMVLGRVETMPCGGGSCSWRWWGWPW